MSLFKKPKRNFRLRELKLNDSDNDEENVQKDNVTPNHEKKEKTRKNSVQPKPSKSSLLSFDDEEEDGGTEVFKVKKSSVSRRLVKMKNKEKKKVKVKSTKEEIHEEPDIIIKQNIPIKQAEPIENGNEEEFSSGSDDNEPSRPDDPVRKALECGAIPDAAMIHAARKQREQARQMGASGDYISLDEPKEELQGSRLIRDDENDLSDEEDSGRISFSVNRNEKERAKVVEAFLEYQKRDEDLSDNEEEGDEEILRWEDEQIRKGVGIVQVQSDTSYYTNQGNPVHDIPSYKTTAYSQNNHNFNQPLQKSVGFKVPTKPLEEITTAMIKLRLENRLQTLREVHRAHQLEMDKLEDDMVNSQSLISELKGSGPRIASKFNFYQEMRGYVTDLVECLNEKVVIINSLEERMHSLLADRASRLVKRRQQDCADQAEEVSSVGAKVPPKSQSTTDPEKRRRQAEREGRRIRRRKNRESRLPPGFKHYEGLSSDDEEERTVADNFKVSMETILRESQDIFADVNEDFGDINSIKYWFERWKEEYPESYSEAYISLCLPKLFGPFIRVELLSWNPLEQIRNIETMQWYRNLLSYGCHKGSSFNESDSDIDLIPLVVEKIILVKLTDLVTRVWDPLSTSQTTHLVNLVSRLCDDYPTLVDTSSYTKNLLKAIAGRIKKSLEDDIFVPLYPRQLLENRTFTGLQFFQRQLWCCVKLLTNILKWDTILADKPLSELSINGLLNRYMILGLQNSPVNFELLEKAKFIYSAFPKSWFNEKSLDVGLNSSQLLMFTRFLKSTAEYVGKEKSSINSDIPNSKEYLKELLKILLGIGERELAQSISKQFSVF